MPHPADLTSVGRIEESLLYQQGLQALSQWRTGLESGMWYTIHEATDPAYMIPHSPAMLLQ